MNFFALIASEREMVKLITNINSIVNDLAKYVIIVLQNGIRKNDI